MNELARAKPAPYKPVLYVLCLHTVLFGLSPSSGVCADIASPPAQIDNPSIAATDAALTAKVKAGLQTEDSLKQSDIDVTTSHGVVTLEGAASSPDAKSTAGAATLLIEGVKDVDNALTTSNPCTAAANTKQVKSDSWITRKVKAEIHANSLGNRFQISVSTRRGIVSLKGVMGNQDAIDYVKSIAGKVKGVKCVNTSALRNQAQASNAPGLEHR